MPAASIDQRSRGDGVWRPAPGVMARPKGVVADRLDRAVGGVALVVAPGGFGKTTQVALWAQRQSRPVMWVDLEPCDNDPEWLVDALLSAFRDVLDVDASVLRGGGAWSGHAVATVAPALGALVHRCATPFVMVLDDVHVIDELACLDVLEALVRQVPAGSTVVVISRDVPAFSLSGVRMRAGVVDVSTEQLALDEHEAGDLLRAMGARLQQATVAEIVAQTGGWALGVRLAGLVSAGAPDAGQGRLPKGYAATRAVREYVQQEWLSGLSVDDADFLLRICGLGWVCASLCDHVLGAADSGSRLERLYASGLLVAPLQRRGDWFRAHQVLRTAMESAFSSRDRDGYRVVQRKASYWFERTGEIDRAVEHALRADEVALAGRLVIEYGPAYHTSGRTQTVKRWIDALPRPYVLGDPGLCLVAAIVSFGSGDGGGAAAWTRFGEQALDRGGTDPDAMIGLRLLAFRSMLCVDDMASSLVSATRAFHALPAGLWRAFAGLTRGALSFALDDDVTAIECLSEAAAELHILDALTLEAVSLAHCALVFGSQGRWDQSVDVARTARQILRSGELEQFPSVALVTAASALAEARTGNTTLARSEVFLTRGHLALLSSVADWQHLQARIAVVGMTS